jgi:hypothetical protein
MSKIHRPATPVTAGVKMKSGGPITSRILGKMPALLLAAVLQAVPLAKNVLPMRAPAISPFAIIARSAVSLAAFGAYDAVAGASTPVVINSPSAATAADAAGFTYRITTSQYYDIMRYTATGLPAGIAPLNLSVSPLINGTPDAIPGVYNVTLTVSALGEPTLQQGLLLTILPGAVPRAVTNLTAVAATNSVALKWTRNSTGQLGFLVQRASTSAGPFMQVGSVLPSNPSFTDSGLAPASTYFYQVVATNYGGLSAPSHTLSITTSNGPPSYSAPSLAAVPNQMVAAGTLLSITNSASQSNVPPLPLVFSLDPGAPANAVIDPATGIFNWTPPLASPQSTNQITVRVTASNTTPALTASQTFSIIVVSRLLTLMIDANGHPNLAWNAIPGRTYQVAYKNVLTDSSWQPLVPPFVAADSWLSITDSSPPLPQRFYQVAEMDSP